MFTQKLLSIFTPAPKSHSLLKFIDIYDRHSFIRQYIFEYIPVLALTYLFFYWALWYADKVVKKIEQTNREMQATVEDNKTKIDDVLALKNKRQEYEEVVIKAKRAQRITAHKLESEIQKLKDDLMETTEKLTSLEKILGKRLSGTKDSNVKVSDVCEEDTESSEKIVRDSLEDIKLTKFFNHTVGKTADKFILLVTLENNLQSPVGERSENPIVMVVDTGTVRLVIFIGMFLVFAGDYTSVINSIFGNGIVPGNSTLTRLQGPVKEGPHAGHMTLIRGVKDSEADDGSARKAKIMATIKTACLPKLICELTSTPYHNNLSEMEKSLLKLIRDTSLTTMAEVASRYHFAAHMGQLISGIEGQGCHNFYPTCPLPRSSVLNMMKKIRLR